MFGDSVIELIKSDKSASYLLTSLAAFAVIAFRLVSCTDFASCSTSTQAYQLWWNDTSVLSRLLMLEAVKFTLVSSMWDFTSILHQSQHAHVKKDCSCKLTRQTVWDFICISICSSTSDDSPICTVEHSCHMCKSLLTVVFRTDAGRQLQNCGVMIQQLTTDILGLLPQKNNGPTAYCQQTQHIAALQDLV